MSKPFMFHFTAKLYTIFYSRNFFRNFFLKKAKKISPRKKIYVEEQIKICYKTYFYDTRAKKTPKAGRLSELIFSRAQSLRND